jgi:5-methylcytosine-specific restriction endonuclease McrA
MRPKPLSKENIENACAKTLSNRAAARYLGCSYNHYKVYAKLYKLEDGRSMFEAHLNRSGKGIPKFLSTNGKHTALVDILEGRVPLYNFTPQKIRDRLIVEGFLEERCHKCDFHEKRVLDSKCPLILNFIDGNKKNYKLSNLELVCYNCFFLYVNDVFSERQVNHLEDYTPVPSTQKVDWETTETLAEHFKYLSVKEDPSKSMDGTEFISRLK